MKPPSPAIRDSSPGTPFDAAIVGGGILGATVALHLARGGMRVVLVERRGVCAEASGVNAGTLSMLHFRRPELVAYALKAQALWRTAPTWLGAEVGFAQQGGLNVAFDQAEAAELEAKVDPVRAAGAPVELVAPARARAIEPSLSPRAVLAAYTPLDGHANAAVSGRAYRSALLAAGVEVREGCEVAGIEASHGFRLRCAAPGSEPGTADGLAARRLVLAGGVWLADMGRWLGLEIPVRCRVQQMVVTERVPPVLRTILGVPNGRFSLKQVANGTVLIGGGWLGAGDYHVGGYAMIRESFVGNVRLARHAVPALARARIVRTWFGPREVDPEHRPLIGPLPGVADGWIIGCGISGFTMGPYMGRLLADAILGREPEMALFDPAWAITPRAA